MQAVTEEPEHLESSASASVASVADQFRKLENLKSLLQAGFITEEEYEERRAQIVDEMTGTTTTATNTRSSSKRTTHSSISEWRRRSSASRRRSRQRSRRRSSDEHDEEEDDEANTIIVVPRGPPDFTRIEPELAVKHTYLLEERRWASQRVRVKLDPVPFSKGALRLVYHMQELPLEDGHELDKDVGSVGQTPPLSSVPSYTVMGSAGPPLFAAPNDAPDEPTFVLKISMDPRDNASRQVYFLDVEMQAVAKYYAEQYNSYNPPKRVDFVKAYLFELVSRESRPICGVERFIVGPYRKHNNNYGYVSEAERNTPQAFSHFSYEASGHRVLICDIQGVGDMYTDPQIHSIDGKGFGKGNIGQRGIDKFLKSHRCNIICRYLKLPPINASYKDVGTLPVTKLMPADRIRVVDVTGQDAGPGDPTQPLLPPIVGSSAPRRRRKQPVSLCSCCTIL